MTLARTRTSIAAFVGSVALSACAAAAGGAVQTAPQPVAAPQASADTARTAVTTHPAAIAKARTDSARLPYTAADIHFMSGMIGHHAQAITIAAWAPTHGANPSVRRLAERIINAQQDEITLMQQWLLDRRQPVPEATAKGMTMMMDGVAHVMMMPGMLSDDQMQRLNAARGKEFDDLFLTLMIQHHRGAVGMVKELFGTYGAGQDETVFKFASDVSVDQSTEIARMEQMLLILKLERGSP